MMDEVWFIISNLNIGGAQNVCVQLANAFDRHGIRVNLIVLHLDADDLSDTLENGVNVINIGRKHLRNSLYKIALLLNKNRPARVLVFNHQIAAAVVVMKVLLRLKMRVVARNISSLKMKRKFEKSIWHKWVVYAVVKMLFRHVDFIVSQSTGMKEELMAEYGFNRDNVAVIPNPVSRKLEDTAGNRRKKPEGKKNEMLYVGRISYIKGIDNLVEIFKRCRQSLPELRLRIVGKGEMRDDLAARIEREGLEESVILEGFRSDLVDYYLQADVTVLTSFYEGLPNVLIESVCLGTPVVAFNCPYGPRDIVMDGINGFLVAPGDVVTFAARVVDIVKNPHALTDITRGTDRFRMNKIFPQYYNVLCN